MNRPGNVLGSIAMCTRDHINAQTATSLWMTDLTVGPPGTSVNSMFIQGSILTSQRNEAVKRMEGGWLIFIDDDMTFQPNAIKRLVASWQEVQDQFTNPVIMGGLCHRRGTPHEPTLYAREHPTEGGYRFIETWEDDIVEVDATGMAFVLIPVNAFDQILRMSGTELPTLEKRLRMEPPPFFTWDGITGEDLQFCAQAKEAGCRIFVDTRIEIGHVAEVNVGHREFLLQVAGRDPETLSNVKVANDKLGIPTLTPAQAVEKLRLMGMKQL